MRVCVLGAGAIGGWMGVKLAQAGDAVSVLARGATLAAIRAEGLRLIEAGETAAVKVAASDKPGDLTADAFPDLLIVAGRVAMKMLPVLQRIWLQMTEPKWCISMGACACTGGVFDTYAVVQGVDRFVPVDMYVPGCPPRPEQLLAALIEMQEKIMRTGTIYGREFAKRTTSAGPPRGRL